jgi:hypothetical protein
MQTFEGEYPGFNDLGVSKTYTSKRAISELTSSHIIIRMNYSHCQIGLPKNWIRHIVADKCGVNKRGTIEIRGFHLSIIKGNKFL